MFDLRSIGPSAFGAEIHGLDIGHELSDAVVGEVLDALYAHRFLVIKNQRLDEARYLAFGRLLWRLGIKGPPKLRVREWHWRAP